MLEADAVLEGGHHNQLSRRQLTYYAKRNRPLLRLLFSLATLFLLGTLTISFLSYPCREEQTYSCLAVSQIVFSLISLIICN